VLSPRQRRLPAGPGGRLADPAGAQLALQQFIDQRPGLRAVPARLAGDAGHLAAGTVVEDGEQSGDMAEFGPAIMSGMTLLPTARDQRGERPAKRYDPDEEARNTEIFGQELTADQEATIEWLEVRRGRLRAVRFMLGSMRKPMAAMRACTDELMTHWGIDLDAHRGLTRAAAPKSNPGDWISSRDYPRDLLRKGAQGLVQFRLSISAEGMPTQCHIQQSTRPEGFDKAVCETLMRRARFEPALGANGQPIASFWRSAVRFMMPD